MDTYDRLMDALTRTVDALNVALGISPDCRHRVTIGYIGNCDINGRNDDRLWSVFLPHPGRVGGPNDRIGSWRTGDLAGMRAALTALSGVLRFARWSADPFVTAAMTDQRTERERRDRAARRAEAIAYAAEHGIDWTPGPLDDVRAPTARLVNGEWQR